MPVTEQRVHLLGEAQEHEAGAQAGERPTGVQPPGGVREREQHRTDGHDQSAPDQHSAAAKPVGGQPDEDLAATVDIEEQGAEGGDPGGGEVQVGLDLVKERAGDGHALEVRKEIDRAHHGQRQQLAPFGPKLVVHGGGGHRRFASRVRMGGQTRRSWSLRISGSKPNFRYS